MFFFRLESLGPAFDWKPGLRRFQSGHSFIEPFQHPSLEHFALAGGDAALFVVRERVAGLPRRSDARSLAIVDDGTFDRELRAAREWPLDFSIIVTRNGGGDRATVYAGGWGTAPVYLLAGRETLHASWEPADLYPFARSSEPLDEALSVELLVRCGTPYSRRTVIKDVSLLTANATARWRPDASTPLRIDYPPPVAPPRPRPVKHDADVLGTFREILTASIRRGLDAGHVIPGTELSGGLDSAIVAAITAQTIGRPLRTYGLAMPPPSGDSQRGRRDELIRRFGFLDCFIPATEHPPLSDPRRLEEAMFVPWHEFYTEAFGHLAGLAANDGCTSLLTGNGGDELLYLHGFELTDEERERERRSGAGEVPPFLTPRARDIFHASTDALDVAPPSTVAASALHSASSASPLAMRKGIWPVHPLCTPELVRFCGSLPSEWRDERALERRFLASLGCSPAMTHPATTETFSDLMSDALRGSARPLLENLFDEPRLASMGLVDRDALIAAYRRFCSCENNDETMFWAVAILELTARSIESRVGSRTTSKAHEK